MPIVPFQEGIESGRVTRPKIRRSPPLANCHYRSGTPLGKKRTAIASRLTSLSLLHKPKPLPIPGETRNRRTADFAGCADEDRLWTRAAGQKGRLKTGKVGTPFLK
jgi:hypothetical protein